MTYRREIDGLRAIAVLSVILFHAGFGLFSGGFIGVDIFFVISGYLITSLILKDQDRGTFSLLKFYERRARRILPALFVMLLCCLPFAAWLLLPADLDDFSKILAGVATFSSNIVLWATSGYFNAENELKPLLHMWTLAVEEQYYWIFPCLMAATTRLSKRRLTVLFSAIALISLALAQWGVYHLPTATFYMLPTRAWELLIGALLAIFLATKPPDAPGLSHILAELLSGAGLALIAVALFCFNSLTPFPSLYALVPTVGAALIIYAAHSSTQVGRLLGSKLFVGLGLLSYSAYLYHQPLFAFARLESATELSAATSTALSLVTLLLAFLSYRFIETPFRNRNAVSARRVWQVSTTGTVIFLTLGIGVHLAQGFPARLTREQQAVAAFSNYKVRIAYREGTCFLRPEQGFGQFSKACAQVSANAPVSLIWGDSHAAALSSGLRMLLPNLVQYTASACPPLLDTDFGVRGQCRAINDFVLSEIKRLQPQRVILHADWLSYRREDATSRIGVTIEAIHRASPRSEVRVIGGVPKWITGFPTVLLQHKLDLDATTRLQTPFYPELQRADVALQLAAQSHQAKFLSALEALCNETGCDILTGAVGSRSPVTWDNAHLTQPGAVLLSQKLLAEGLL